MAIDDILKRIDEEAEARCGEVRDEARRAADAVRDEYEEKAERLAEELRLRAEKRAREEERRLIVNERLALRKELLTRKRALLDALCEKALRRIGELPRDRYRELMTALILDKAVSGAEEIIVPADQRDLFGDTFLTDLNDAYPGGGRFTLASAAGDFTWGVVLREGKRVIDLTLAVLFEQLRERIEPDIAAVIFPAEDGRGKD